MSSVEPGDNQLAWTDADGNYEFRGLPAGSYSLIVDKQGFLPGEWGATLPGDVGRPIPVREGESAKDVDVRLARAGAVSGRVTDEFGDPVALAAVSVFRARNVGGLRQVTAVAQDHGGTDDLGQYRVWGLPAGTYYVGAVGIDRRIDAGAQAGVVPTYYPSTTTIGEAQALTVGQGQDVTNIDIRLATLRRTRVSGVVLDPDDRPATSGGVGLIEPFTTRALRSYAATINGDGTFAIDGVPPGDYLLRAWFRDAHKRRSDGGGRVTVAGDEVSNVTIRLGPGGTLSGRVIFDGQGGRPKVRIVASGFDIGTTEAELAPAVVAADGTFTLTGLLGDVLLRVEEPSSSWALKSVVVNGRESADTPIAFEGREHLSNVQVVLTDQFPRLTGVVSDSEGRPQGGAFVTVFADDSSRWGPFSRYRATGRAGADGLFTLGGLPTGDYIAVALAGSRALDLEDADVLERLQKIGVKVSLPPGTGTKVLPLVLASLNRD